MNKGLIKIIALIFGLFSTFCFSQDYLVTNENDTIYGKVEWKTNITVYVKTKDGKKKFKANQAKFFKRGDFKFSSIKTSIPEFLLEVKKGKVSYYKESHLKSRFTLNYVRQVFLEYNDKIYPINVDTNIKGSGFISNIFGNIQGAGQLGFYSSNFKWSFYQILGKENTLYQLIKNNNYTFEDIELLVDLANISIENKSDFEKRIDTTLKSGYAKGYVIKKEKDTIFGSIKMNRRFVLSDKVNFISKSGTESSYEPKELIEFKINDRTYKNVQIKNKIKHLVQIIEGEISMYRDLKKRQSYLTKDFKEFIAVDKKEKYLKLFKDKPKIYKRIIDNEYKYFEFRSVVKLYNNAPQHRI
ncbi:hypothetical protein IMCC3317_08540 [Kordia antarctica]|uniref:Uncharacterized protein n=1 Tax=Kordia antarctica TaxID=1218801 RepID=A0A7L4ZFL4_9FLAO|nr:hypothetical protein [Kordia antarctica]QHI35508.1 hypothetical protein IMCC3317_08540 [Kordia antarctica]